MKQRFPNTSAAQVGLAPEAVQRFADALHRWVDRQQVVGAAVAIVVGGRKVLHATAGWANRGKRQPIRANTLFRVRSMTKPLTGTAVLQLAEQGRLSLDDPIAAHLPSFDNPRSRDITIDHLLHHIGGLEHPGFPDPIRRYSTLREAADAVGQSGPAATPGTRFAYCDAGPAVLGAVVAQVMGMAVEHVVEARILVPLELDDTFCRLRRDAPIRRRVSCSYKPAGDGWIKYWDQRAPQLNRFFPACGGLYTTVDDYARFMSVWMHGGRFGHEQLLSAASVRRALRSHPLSFGDDELGGYGRLWRLYSEPDGEDDAVLRVFGHDGSDGTWAMAIPELDLMVLYFSQSRDGGTLLKVMELVRGLEPSFRAMKRRSPDAL